MFDIGDRVVYDYLGVYTIKEISKSPVDLTDERLFYFLVPMHEPACNIVVTPVTNDKVRRLVSVERAEEIIRSMPSIQPLDVEQEKNRRELYKKVMSSNELEDYIRVIKTVHSRREELSKVKKRISETDAEYEKRAKHGLYSELAVIYGVQMTEVERLITDKIENAG